MSTPPPHAADPIELMLSHRSIRSYTDEPVSRADLDRAIRAGQMAATSSAVQAYGVIRVTNRGNRDQLASLCGPQEKVALAPEFFVICGDVRRHRLIQEQVRKAYEQRLEGFMLAVIDATLFAQNMVLAFEAMGYGTCYIGGLRNDLAAVVELLKLPIGVYPVFGLCVGRPGEQPTARPRLASSAVVFDDAYPSDECIYDQLEQYDDQYAGYLRDRGASAAGWTSSMLRKFESTLRPQLASVYKAQGADLS